MGNNKMTCDCNIIHQEAVDYVSENILDKTHIDKLCAIYKIMSDNTRLEILLALDLSEMCVCDLSAMMNMTKSAISHQLKVLKAANLVSPRRDGKNVYYNLSDYHVKQMIELAMEHIECKECECCENKE